MYPIEFLIPLVFYSLSLAMLFLAMYLLYRKHGTVVLRDRGELFGLASAFTIMPLTAIMQLFIYDRHMWTMVNSFSYLTLAVVPYLFLRLSVSQTQFGSIQIKQRKWLYDRVTMSVLLFFMTVFFLQFYWNAMGASNPFTRAVVPGDSGYGPYTEVHGPLWFLTYIVLIAIIGVCLVIYLYDIYRFRDIVVRSDRYFMPLLVMSLMLSLVVNTYLIRYSMSAGRTIDAMIPIVSLSILSYVIVVDRYERESPAVRLFGETSLKPGLYILEDDGSRKAGTFGSALRGIRSEAVCINLGYPDDTKADLVSSTQNLSGGSDEVILSSIERNIKSHYISYICGMGHYSGHSRDSIADVIGLLDVLLEMKDEIHSDTRYVFILGNEEHGESRLWNILEYFLPKIRASDRVPYGNPPDIASMGIIRYTRIKKKKEKKIKDLRKETETLKREEDTRSNVINALGHEINTYITEVLGRMYLLKKYGIISEDVYRSYHRIFMGRSENANSLFFKTSSLQRDLDEEIRSYLNRMARELKGNFTYDIRTENVGGDNIMVSPQLMDFMDRIIWISHGAFGENMKLYVTVIWLGERANIVMEAVDTSRSGSFLYTSRFPGIWFQRLDELEDLTYVKNPAVGNVKIQFSADAVSLMGIKVEFHTNEGEVKLRPHPESVQETILTPTGSRTDTWT